MYTSSGLLALAATLSTALAAQGFNYGSTKTDGSPKVEQDFVNEFNAAKKLPGTNGAFTSARLYTMIQGQAQPNSQDVAVIEAIPAAIKTNTRLLLGLWASVDDKGFQKEIDALSKALSTYPELKNLVDGISVGSEDLYRISPLDQKPEVGTDPATLTRYIQKTKDTVNDAKFSAKVGHVDTWTAWVNGSNSAVVDASDFLGVDAYPYFQNTMNNPISEGKALFDEAVAKTKSAAKGKSVWITETGWPISGPDSNKAKPSTQNAKQFWDAVGCGELFGKTNVWWYTLQDASPTTPSPSFGILGSNLNSQPLYDLSCKDVSSASASQSGSATKSGSHSAGATGHDSTGSDSSGSSASGSGAASGSLPTGGAGSSGNSSTTFAASTASPTGGAGATGGSGSGSGSDSGSGSGTSPAASATGSGIATGSAVTKTASLAGAFGAFAVAALFL